jgi:hypothetical protein
MSKYQALIFASHNDRGAALEAAVESVIESQQAQNVSVGRAGANFDFPLVLQIMKPLEAELGVSVYAWFWLDR